jgi:3-isopropylmalate/(R)-2-methylmalate dehydratase small subunit
MSPNDNICGRVWKFGDSVDTDMIVAGQYLDSPMEEIIKHVCEKVNGEFPRQVSRGDVIVAGKNFGCGSSREQAPAALKEVGISCVIADTFARIFFRNAIAIGMPVLRCPGIVARFNDGDTCAVSLHEGRVENRTTGDTISASRLSDEMLRIINRGGILELLKDLKEST